MNKWTLFLIGTIIVYLIYEVYKIFFLGQVFALIMFFFFLFLAWVIIQLDKAARK
jgi:hypothetical protein